MPLPAPVALANLELGEGLLRTITRATQDPNMPLLRDAVATVTAYVFFNRGECSAYAKGQDLAVNNTHITMLLRREKGHKGLNAGYRNIRQIPTLIAALLRAFFQGQSSMGPAGDKQSRRWSITPREEREMWSADTLTELLRTAFTAAKCPPRARGLQLDLTLRKGAASTSHAIGVRLTDIRCAGGWATTSNVLETKYIDFTIDAALPGCAIILRIPPEGHCPLRLLSTLPSPSAPIVCPLVLAN